MRELQDIERWLQLNGLFINVTKTEVMLFGTSQGLSKVDNFKININGYKIKRVNKFKYLGVIFDEHINWNEHVKAIVSKAGTRIGLLGRMRRYIPSYNANAIYLSMIRPIVEYYSGVWVLWRNK